MSHVSVALGDVIFQDYEVPEKIRFGGIQRVVTHALIGGGNVIDTLGQSPSKIQFSGIFSSSQAVLRAQRLDQAREQGRVLALSWDEYYEQVIIASFEADFTKPWWIPFSVICVVVDNPASQLAEIALLGADAISADLSAAIALAPQVGLNAGLFSATNLVGAQSELAASFANNNTALAANSLMLGTAVDPQSGIIAINQLSLCSGSLAATTKAQAYVSRAIVNSMNEMS